MGWIKNGFGENIRMGKTLVTDKNGFVKIRVWDKYGFWKYMGATRLQVLPLWEQL